MTSAPSQASVWVHEVPASNCVRSTTRTPLSAPSAGFTGLVDSGIGSFGMGFLLVSVGESVRLGSFAAPGSRNASRNRQILKPSRRRRQRVSRPGGTRQSLPGRIAGDRRLVEFEAEAGRGGQREFAVHRRRHLLPQGAGILFLLC